LNRKLWIVQYPFHHNLADLLQGKQDNRYEDRHGEGVHSSSDAEINKLLDSILKVRPDQA
jgi:hypothetical protein